jgi:hypothetical protein
MLFHMLKVDYSSSRIQTTLIRNAQSKETVVGSTEGANATGDGVPKVIA